MATKQRFIAKLLPGIKIDAGDIKVKLGVATDQLLALVHLIPYIAGTTPEEREFRIRIAAKDCKLFSWKARLWDYKIDHDAYTKLTLVMDHGLSISVLSALIDKTVAVEVSGGAQ